MHTVKIHHLITIRVRINVTKIIRYDKNPFIQNMVIPVGSKQVQISTYGKENNVLINKTTGEITSTHVVAYKKVDRERFVKTFADYMAFTFDLTKAGNKALRVVMWAIKEHAQAKDIVILDSFTLSNFLEGHGHLDPQPVMHISTFFRGLSELEKAKIIAKTIRKGAYYINPDVMYNGNRIAFSAVIEREDERKAPRESHVEIERRSGDAHLQQELLPLAEG